MLYMYTNIGTTLAIEDKQDSIKTPTRGGRISTCKIGNQTKQPRYTLCISFCKPLSFTTQVKRKIAVIIVLAYISPFQTFYHQCNYISWNPRIHRVKDKLIDDRTVNNETQIILLQRKIFTIQ